MSELKKDDLVERAVAFFGEQNCAQSVLMAYAPHLGLDIEVARSISGPFGGGVADQGRTCGAVTGALMVVGLRCADASKEEMESVAAIFLERFNARHETTVCKELLGLDVSIPEELEMAREQGIFFTHCPNFVRDAVEILGELF